MHTRISDLFDIGESRYRMALHAGHGGLVNSVSWVYLAEDIQNMSFLRGGELVITTGLFRQSGSTLRDFLAALAGNHCSGVVLNLGNYLLQEDLTKEIRDICEMNAMPLFTIPWEVRLVDIMQDFSRLLLLDSHEENLLSAAFQSAIQQTPVQDGILRTLNRCGYTTLSDYRVIVLENLKDPTLIASPLNGLGIQYHLLAHDSLQILILAASGLRVPLQKLADMLCCRDGIRIGVGDLVHSLADIAQSFERARFALAAAALRACTQIVFDDLGLFQVLFCVSDRALLQAIRRRQLGTLEDHDATHGSEYLETLCAWLLSDGSLLRTADRMHAHRNTIVYRIRRIRELLGSELDDADAKFNLLMALHIREYLMIDWR